MAALIFAYPNDLHARAVQWALEEIGETSSLVFWGDFPGLMTISMEPHRGTWSIKGPEVFGGSFQFDVMWNRRTARPTVPAYVHEADQRLVKDIGGMALPWFQAFAESTVVSINPLEGKIAVENKALQLRVASELGFQVPRTLISNDPDKVRLFVKSCGRTIVKAPKVMKWLGADYSVSVLTTHITSQDLDDGRSISSCPMIYQEMIEKKFEYRAVVMGNDITFIEIDSQASAQSSVDWRAVPSTALRLREIPCDPRLAGSLLAYMTKFNLVFGCFDLALTKAGDWVFFELNEQGQFLWIEGNQADIPMLDRFARFLKSGDRHYRRSESASRIRLADFERVLDQHPEISRLEIHADSNLSIENLE